MENEREKNGASDGALKRVKAARLGFASGTREDETVSVAVESVLTLDMGDMGLYSLMCTPSDTRALAVGFAFTEGLIRGLDDISLLAECPDAPGVIRMKFDVGATRRGALPGNCIGGQAAAGGAQGPVEKRGRAVASSCGMCGAGKTTAEIIGGLPEVPVTMKVAAALLKDVGSEMQERQGVFRRTGGTHAAALFDSGGSIVSFAEDIGRHNAVDKAVGKRLLGGGLPCGLGVFLSGRASLEIAAKCARAGVEILAAVSAPTTLAVEVAAKCGLTLCAFVREDRATVFTWPQRVSGLSVRDSEREGAG
jgi:FdhD protein